MSFRNQTQNGFLSHRPLSPKLNVNSPTSTNHPQNNSSISSNTGLKNHFDAEHINLIHKENTVLREENQALRRELMFMKREKK